jgi:DNA-binding NarL/FixJ family response regulator
VEDGSQLFSEIEKLQPDVALIDISIPLLNGVQGIREARRISPHTKVIVLTRSDMTLAMEAFEAGASGYLLKTAAASAIRSTIRKALAGETTMVVDENFPQEPAARQLTARQLEVLQLIAEGRSAREIADRIRMPFWKRLRNWRFRK